MVSLTPVMGQNSESQRAALEETDLLATTLSPKSGGLLGFCCCLLMGTVPSSAALGSGLVFKSCFYPDCPGVFIQPSWEWGLESTITGFEVRQPCDWLEPNDKGPGPSQLTCQSAALGMPLWARPPSSAVS